MWTQLLAQVLNALYKEGLRIIVAHDTTIHSIKTAAIHTYQICKENGFYLGQWKRDLPCLLCGKICCKLDGNQNFGVVFYTQISQTAIPHPVFNKNSKIDKKEQLFQENINIYRFYMHLLNSH